MRRTIVELIARKEIAAITRSRALWVPMVHATELLRAGYFGPQQATFHEPAYLVVCCMVLTLGALLLLRDTRTLLEQRR